MPGSDGHLRARQRPNPCAACRWHRRSRGTQTRDPCCRCQWRHLKAKADTTKTPGTRLGGKPNRGEDYFFREVWGRKFGEQSIAAWQGFIDHVTEADIP